MNPYEVYRLSNALRLHFTQAKYDFFKQGTHNRSSAPEYYDKLSIVDKNLYERISQMREPKTYLVGNYIFNESKFVRSFTEDGYLKYRAFNVNGRYNLQQDLKHFKPKFNDNITTNSTEEFPFIINLYMRGKISLYTLCTIEKLTKWTDRVPPNILTESTIYQVKKSCNFFKIDETLSKETILKHYK